MKHTRSPWKVAGQGNANGELIITGPDGEIGCIREEARLGDAHLMAAAPDLLECLQEFVNAWHAGEDMYPTRVERSQEIIAKATGK